MDYNSEAQKIKQKSEKDNKLKNSTENEKFRSPKSFVLSPSVSTSSLTNDLGLSGGLHQHRCPPATIYVPKKEHHKGLSSSSGGDNSSQD